MAGVAGLHLVSQFDPVGFGCTAEAKVELVEMRAQKHTEAARVSTIESEYTAATLALRSAETRRDSALAEVGALRAENERLGD